MFFPPASLSRSVHDGGGWFALILVMSNRAIMATIMKVLKMPVRPMAMYTGAINAGPRP